MRGLVDYFQRGGGVMWLLLAVAIIAVAIIIERLFTLYIKARGNPKKMVDKVIGIIKNGSTEEAMEYLAKTPSPVAKILLAGLEKYEFGRNAMEDAMLAKSTSELAFLDRGMIYLSSAATIAPILGFLGTVTGMIRAFQAIALAGEVEPTLVAAGISEALITTATGLIIAAPVAIFYALFSQKINSFTRDMEEASNMFLEQLLELGIIKS